MRTTMIINDELYRQVKARARAEERTVTSFVEEALRARLADADRDLGPVDIQLMPAYRGAGGVRAGIDATSNASLLDAADDGASWETLR